MLGNHMTQIDPIMWDSRNAIKAAMTGGGSTHDQCDFEDIFIFIF